MDNTKKLVNYFSFTSITEAFQNTMEFFISLDFQSQIVLFNSLCSAFLLSLLSSYLFGKYGNYLIEKFNLEVKYPKLGKILKARLQFQKYYFIYLTILSIATLLFNLFINLNVLLT